MMSLGFVVEVNVWDVNGQVFPVNLSVIDGKPEPEVVGTKNYTGDIIDLDYKLGDQDLTISLSQESAAALVEAIQEIQARYAR